MDRDDQDRDVAVEQRSLLQKRMEGKIESPSFDRGYHSPQNQIDVGQIVDHLCLPKPGYKQAARQEQEADPEFCESKKATLRHRVSYRRFANRKWPARLVCFEIRCQNYILEIFAS